MKNAKKNAKFFENSRKFSKNPSSEKAIVEKKFFSKIKKPIVENFFSKKHLIVEKIFTEK